MKLAIVGADGDKWASNGVIRAKNVIYQMLSNDKIEKLVSGHCHKGGVDIWAEEAAIELNKFDPKLIFLPATLSWSGFKRRNIEIAAALTPGTDELVCITPNQLPDRSGRLTLYRCAHCASWGQRSDHVQNGGCWTARHAALEFKVHVTIVAIYQ